MEQRNRFINTRFTEIEFKNIGAAAKNLGYSRSEYLRLLILKDSEILTINNKSTTSEEYKTPITDEKELKLLLNIANNINQIAKISNQTKQAPSVEVLINIQNKIGNYLDNKMQ